MKASVLDQVPVLSFIFPFTKKKASILGQVLVFFFLLFFVRLTFFRSFQFPSYKNGGKCFRSGSSSFFYFSFFFSLYVLFFSVPFSFPLTKMEASVLDQVPVLSFIFPFTKKKASILGQVLVFSFFFSLYPLTFFCSFQFHSYKNGNKCFRLGSSSFFYFSFYKKEKKKRVLFFSVPFIFALTKRKVIILVQVSSSLFFFFFYFSFTKERTSILGQVLVFSSFFVFSLYLFFFFLFPLHFLLQKIKQVSEGYIVQVISCSATFLSLFPVSRDILGLLSTILSVCASINRLQLVLLPNSLNFISSFSFFLFFSFHEIFWTQTALVSNNIVLPM